MAEDKANEARAKASVAEILLKRVEDGVDKIGLKIGELENDVRSAQDSIRSSARAATTARENAEKVQAQIEEISVQLADLRRQAEELRGTLGIFGESDLRFLATLRLIDRHRRNLFITGNPWRREQAEWALLEKTHTDSPMVRRECVIALSGIRDPSEAVVERFEEIVAEEDDPEVKRLAEVALKSWKSTSS